MAIDWRRGFIAAPLLGTLIFLAAIVFVAHVNQVDRTETATVVSETYHNRIVNILEDYRADLGAIFAVNVVRAIQKHLTSECWTLFSLSNERPDPTLTGSPTNPGTQRIPPVPFIMRQMNFDNLPFCGNSPAPAGNPPVGCSVAAIGSNSPSNPNSFLCRENCNQQLDYFELRYQKCAQVSEIIKDGICPYEKDYGITAWIDSTRGVPADPNDPNSARSPYSFEGINLSLSNDALVQSSFIDRIECEMQLGGETYRMPINGNLVYRRIDRQEQCVGSTVGTRYCGNGVCDGGESSSSCSTDCSGTCGNGICEFTESDTRVSGKTYCPGDCLHLEIGRGACECTKNNGCRKKVGTDATGKSIFDDVADGVSVNCKGMPGDVVTGQNIQNCRKLIGDSLFDCRNFAVAERQDGNPFRCCDKFYYNKNDPADADNGRCCTGSLAGSAGCGGGENPPDRKDHEVPGCEQGSFFVKVNILADNDLYRRVPRVIASDKVGNTIQGGALGQENFVVHVKYPIYKYLDAAFQFYAPLAYGASGKRETLSDGTVIDYDFNNPAANSIRHAGRGRIPEDFVPPGRIIPHGPPGRVDGDTEGGPPGRVTESDSRSSSSGPGGPIGRVTKQEGNTITFVPNIGGFRVTPDTGGSNDQNTREGVVEGVCFGGKCQCDAPDPTKPGACLLSHSQSGERTRFAVKLPPNLANNDDAAKWLHSSNKLYYDTFFDPGSPTSVCRLTKSTSNGGICEEWGTCRMQVWTRGYNLGNGREFLLLCPDALSGLQQDPRIKDAFYRPTNPINVLAVSQCVGTQPDEGLCAYIDRLYLTLDFRDFEEKTLVLPEPPAQTAQESPLPHNRFCWYATPSHYNP